MSRGGASLPAMSTAQPLTIRAGATARRRLCDEGFQADAFSTLVGASGGPKWLVLRHLDEVLSERLIGRRKSPLVTLGSSIGSFRHACHAMADPRAAFERLQEAYVHQRYDHGRPTKPEVSVESVKVLDHVLGARGASEVVANEHVRSHFVAVRLRGGDADAGPGFGLRLGASAIANAISRRALGAFYERAVFGPEECEIAWPDFETRNVPLTPENLTPALLASGSIPLVMEGVRGIPGAPGTWLDGGIVDYHFDFRFGAPDGLVLYPHFFDRITPGWFDKLLKWRRPAPEAMDRVVMIAPSDDFVRSLPGGKVPDRKDFETLPTEERIGRWNAVTEQCRVLADDLVSVIDGSRWADRIQPFV